MRRTSRLLAASIVSLATWVAASGVSAKQLSDSFIRIEINDTDGDAGIHIFLDGEGWDSMQCIAPDDSVLFSVLAEGSVGLQGITEFFFESAEPSFDEQSLEELLELFPEGNYRFRGTTTDGRRLRGRARLTHALPDAPVQVFPVEEGVSPDSATFTWEPVPDPRGSEIVGYEIVVGCEADDFVDFMAQVGPDVTSVTVPPEVLDQDGAEECKWEVLAIERSGNQTLSEVEFEVN